MHYLFFSIFSIYMNMLEDKIFSDKEFCKQEFKINSARVLLYQLCNINKFDIYTFCGQSKSKPDRIFTFSVFIFFPYDIKILKILQKYVNEHIICSLLNIKGVKFMRVQNMGKSKSAKCMIIYNARKVLFDFLRSSAPGMDGIYRSELIIPKNYRKLFFKFSKGLHKMKKRSVSNEDYFTNYDLLYWSDGSPLSPHTSSASEMLQNNDIMTNSSIQNYFVRQNVRKVVAENSHLTLNCPETTMDSNVQWYKDNERLNSSFRRNMADTETEPHLTIDAYNSLYILQATKNEEGVYTCYVNDKPFQTYQVIVVSKSKLLNEDIYYASIEFFRYSIYLGFVLSLTITCYCAGICVAWHQRSSFADPLR